MPDVQSFTPKSFLQRPEGKVGLAIPIIAILAVVYVMGSAIGDFLVNALYNTIQLSIGVGVIVGIVLFRKPLFYMYRSFCRFITGLFIDIDPIGVLKTYREQMIKKLNAMKESIDALKGQKIKTSRRQVANESELQNEYGLMNQAKKTDNQSAFGIHGKQVARLETKKTRYEGELNRLTLLTTIMDRYYQLCDGTVTDMGNEIKYREDEKAEAKESRGAVRSAMAILKGLPEKDMWDEATVKLENDYTAALGEVDNFLDVTKNILTQADLQDGADTEKAMKLLDDWQNKNSHVSLGGQADKTTKAEIISSARAQLTAGASGFPIQTGKPQYQTQTQTQTGSSDDDYLNLVK